MENHSEIGERILAKVEDYAEIAKIVRHHHERWDGQGYPDGIAALDTPLISRIISVADAYNAMTSDRPYRDAMPSRVARMRLAQGVESQFDTTDRRRLRGDPRRRERGVPERLGAPTSHSRIRSQYSGETTPEPDDPEHEGPRSSGRSPSVGC